MVSCEIFGEKQANRIWLGSNVDGPVTTRDDILKTYRGHMEVGGASRVT